MKNDAKDEPGRPSGGRRDEAGAPHPLDRWLRRELESLYPAEPDAPLPPQMAELAERLQSALANGENSEKTVKTK